jgi:glycosyltransferase involved in cell wall biosynthesis
MLSGVKEFVKQTRLYEKIFLHQKNVRGATSSRKALLSYLTAPFRKDDVHYSHQNWRQVRVIADVIDELGFQVDVVEYTTDADVSYADYELILGFGYPMENSFWSTDCTATRVYIATGASTQQRNYATLQRVRDLKQRRGVYLPPKRIKRYPDFASSTLADAIVCVGNEFTRGTYREVYDGPIYTLPVSVHQTFDPSLLDRQYEQARRHFLWFGGGGWVHKGLDRCLEAFVNAPECVLHVCGRKEEDFFEAYEEEFGLDNVHYHGYVNINKEKFRNLISKCAYVLFPSCSEAGAGSVITVMQYGLIPVVTREASVDVDEVGYLLSSAESSDIARTVETVANCPPDRVQEQADRAVAYVNDHHTISDYRAAFESALRGVLSAG